jgi:UDP-N-acetylglucosamine 2-epimerase
MKVLIVGELEGRRGLAAALEAESVDVGRPPEGSLPAPAGDEVAELAEALIAFDRLFAADALDAVLVASTSNLALAAVLVATKVRIPVVGLVTQTEHEDRLSELNRGLIAQLADFTAADEDPETIAASLRELTTV